MAESITETARLLVVSRESATLRPLWSVAEPNSWQVEVAPSAWDAIERVQSGTVPHLFLLDLPHADGDCLHILRCLHRLHPDLPVVVICSPEDAKRKREAMQLGAHEVLIRPFDEARLKSAIQRHLRASDLVEADVASENIEEVGPETFFVGASPITKRLRAQAELLAEADVPVLILGEPGSGKEAVARLIHKLSVRGVFPFVKVNCTGMPCDLLEMELFGSERVPSQGTAGTGAGKIERADKSTAFIDELTEMPLALQERLVQVLESKVPARASTDKRLSHDVRILAGTSASIDRALTEKKLREDLYYRLAAFTVQVPPLRQRKSEITFLLRHAMHQLARRYGLPARPFSSVVLKACQQHSWPGNLKELESFVKRYLIVADAELAFNNPTSDFDGNGNRETLCISRGLPRPTEPATVRGYCDQAGPKSLKSLIKDVKCEAERSAIGMALQKTSWNRKAAARLLQVSYRSLLYKIDEYHISASEPILSPLFPKKLASAELSGTVVEKQRVPSHENEWKQFPRSKP